MATVVAHGSTGKAGAAMSNADHKNAQAIKALFGDEALAARLAATRIAVVMPEYDLAPSGKLLVQVLSDVLARLWPKIDFQGHCADMAQKVAHDAAASGGLPGQGLQVQWCPPYDVVVAVACDAPDDSKDRLRVGADGWIAALGATANCGDDLNPVGPAFAAALAAAQVFRRIFAAELDGMSALLISEWKADVRELFGVPDLGVAGLDLGETHVFGVGAVTHGLVWLMEHWPAEVSGFVDLVDQDCYGVSNGQRYAFLSPNDALTGAHKVLAVKTRLDAAHPNLRVEPHSTDLNSYCAERGYDRPLRRVIVGLDSPEGRRHAALKLPERTINMWTGGERLGAARYLPGPGRACLACDYLERTDSPLDEVADVHKQTGLRPDVVRALLDTSRELTHGEAAHIAAHNAARGVLSAESMAGQPLRSVMPMVCAMGSLQLAGSTEAVDVPFPFASLFAGIAGFMMLLKDLHCGPTTSEGWTQHNFKSPSPLLLRALHARKECVCCTEVAHLNEAECLTEHWTDCASNRERSTGPPGG